MHYKERKREKNELARVLLQKKRLKQKQKEGMELKSLRE